MFNEQAPCLFVVQNLDTMWRCLLMRKIAWSGETLSDKSKSPLSGPLRGARTRRSVRARIASPCWDGRLRAGPEHRWGSLCGGGRGWRREEKDTVTVISN